MMMTNGWGFTQFPFVPGHEILGIVTHVGEKVWNFDVGDRVGHGPQRDCCGCCNTCYECRTGNNNLCASSQFTVGLHYGGWATSYQSKCRSFFKIKEEVPGTAAPLFCGGVTAYSPLKRDVVAGMKVGIVGIGGIGHLGIMMANKMGCEVTAISTTPDKEKEARELGAHKFLNSKDPEQVRKHQNSLDYILDTATSHNVSLDLGLLRACGAVNFVGAHSSREHQPFYAASVIGKELTIKGSAAGSRLEMESMIDFCTLHSIYPKSEVYQLTEATQAINSLANNQPRAPRYRAVFDTASYFETFAPNYN